MPGPYRIILTDNHAPLRSAVKSLLEESGEYLVVGEAGDGAQLLKLLQDGVEADALVLDLMMPVMTGVEAAGEIRRLGFPIAILVLTMHQETELLCRAFKVGVNGYALKDGIARDLLPGLRAVIEGKLFLSPEIKGELPATCTVKKVEGSLIALGFAHCTA